MTPSGSSRNTFIRCLAYVIIGTLLFVGFLLFNRPPPRIGGATPGQPLPNLTAAGWLNGNPPDPARFEGKVLVIDAWATWCLPCRERAPDLVYLYEKYHDRGVEFVGLTAESGEQKEQIQRFLDEYQITWLNGYGAEQTLAELKAEAIPMVWVIDRRGQIVWNETSDISLAQGIEKALATP